MPNPRDHFSSRGTPRGFKKFARKVEAFSKPPSSTPGQTLGAAFSQFSESFEQSMPSSVSDVEFQGVGHRVIEVVTPHGTEGRVHLTGLSPFTPDPFGILKAIEGAVIEEIKEMVVQDLEEEERMEELKSKSKSTSKQPDLAAFGKTTSKVK
jgi:hypothetical protein